MRVTNIMTTNKMYNQITKNKIAVDKYYTQLTSGKRIQYASDNPILASRILKFRTTLSEAEQYKRNVEQGYSWLEISEIAVSSVQEIMNKIRDLAVQGANDIYDASDREKIATDIKNLIEEVGVQMNQTYGGRYVFSGYRTDTEVVFNGANDYNYAITQDFDYLSLETFKAYSKLGLDDVAKVFDATRIKLPYTNLTDVSFKVTQNFDLSSISEALPSAPTGNGATYISVLGNNGAFMLQDNISEAVRNNNEITINGATYPIVDYAAAPDPLEQDTVYFDSINNVFFLPDVLTAALTDFGSNPTMQIGNLTPAVEIPYRLTLDNSYSSVADIEELSYDTIYKLDDGTFVFSENTAQALIDAGKIYIGTDEYTIGAAGADITYDDTTTPPVFTLPADLADTTPFSFNTKVTSIELDVLERTLSTEANVSYISSFGTDGAFVLPDDIRDVYLSTGEISIAGKQYDVITEYDPTKPLDQTKVYYDQNNNVFYLPNELTNTYKDSSLPLDLEPPVATSEYTVRIFADESQLPDPFVQGDNQLYYLQDKDAFILPEGATEGALDRGRITIGGKSYNIVQGEVPDPRPDDDINIYYDNSSGIGLFYFPTESIDTTTITSADTITFEKPTIEVSTLTSRDENAYAPLPGQAYYLEDTGELILAADVAEYLTDLGRSGFQISYEKQGFLTGEINPKVYFDCKDLETGKRYDMDDQNINYEFGINVRVGVNSLAKDIFTAEMYSEISEFHNFVDQIKISDQRDLELKYTGEPYNLIGDELDEAVKNQIAEETTNARAVLQSRFEDIIGSMDKYMSSISKQRTDIGSRMSRLELMENRIGDDIVAYTGLLSDNEDVDMMEAIMYLNITESVYQASLSTGAKILQTTLVDYLR